MRIDTPSVAGATDGTPIANHSTYSRDAGYLARLTRKSASFRACLPASIVSSLADLVRSMNCYYSNLIEGHNTHPIDIERALRGDYSDNPRSRDLQLEAKAHMAVQEWIDRGGLEVRSAMTAAGVCELLSCLVNCATGTCALATMSP